MPTACEKYSSGKAESRSNPRTKGNWNLKNYIDVVHELKWITTAAKDIGEAMRVRGKPVRVLGKPQGNWHAH